MCWVRSRAGYRTLSAYPFQHAFEYLRDTREWQATQLDRDRVVVRFELLPGAVLDADEARTRLAERLALAGFGDELQAKFEVVPRLAADAGTGKFRRIVTLIGQPDDLPRPDPAPPAEML